MQSSLSHSTAENYVICQLYCFTQYADGQLEMSCVCHMWEKKRSEREGSVWDVQGGNVLYSGGKSPRKCHRPTGYCRQETS